MTKSKLKGGGEIKIIRCSRCNIPTPYGSAHICDEVDYAEHQLKVNPEIEKWFRKGLRIANS